MAQAQTWIPAPSIPFAQLASGTGPQLPARPLGVLWIALTIASIGATMLAAIY
jgi:hypothetical protein